MRKRPGWGLLVLRVAVGGLFLAHGSEKLFLEGFARVARDLTVLGIPLPMVASVAVALLEFIGGMLLIAGLFTRWAALLLAIEMLAAVLALQLSAGSLLPRGLDSALALLAANVCLLLEGADKFALDARLKRPSYWS